MPAAENNPNRIFGISNFTSGSIYIFINFLFVAKYSVDYFSSPLLITLLFVIGAASLFLFKDRLLLRSMTLSQAKLAFGIVTIVASISMIAIMRQFDPSSIDVGRQSAIVDWLDNFSNGTFPYLAQTRPSGMPFLYVLAWPFYAVGDVGLMQVASFILFAFLLWHEWEDSRPAVLIGLILLLVSPAFWFEIVTRSDLFTNMVVGWAWLKLFDKISEQPSRTKFIFTGLLGGLILATRTILWPIFIIYLVFQLRRLKSESLPFLLALASGFIAINLPFLLWDFDYYLFSGPLAVQAEQLPVVALLAFLIGILIIAFRTKSSQALMPIFVVLLFMMVGSAMALRTIQFGFSKMLWDDQFDISYFCMVLPFLIICLTHINHSKSHVTNRTESAEPQAE